MKSVKILGLLVLIVGVFAIGYWRGQSNTAVDHSPASSSQQSSEMKSESGAMEGHDMSSGSVNVSPEKQQLVGFPDVHAALSLKRRLAQRCLLRRAAIDSGSI